MPQVAVSKLAGLYPFAKPMPETLAPISEYSQQFWLLIHSEPFRSAAPLLSHCFKAAIEHGGLAEQDFRRDAGVSYNPRPARISYILSRDAKISDPVAIAAGVLAAPLEVSIDAYQTSGLPSEVLELAAQSRLPISELAVAPRSAQVIALSCWLDRARHFHLSAELQAPTARQEFIARISDYQQLAHRERLPLAAFFEHWLNRSNRSSRGIAG